MKKRILALLLACTMLGTALAGCSDGTENQSGGTQADGSTASSEAGSEATSSAPTVITGNEVAGATELSMWTFVELHGKFYQTMVDSWNKAHPDKPINLTVTVLPYDDMHNKLAIALQANGEGAPDICDIEIGKFPNFLQGTPQLEDLTDAVAPYRKDLVESRLQIYSKDNKLYGIDFHVGATVMFYNTEMLDKAGVDYKTIKTWDDYAAAGEKVLQATGKPMGVAETSANWTLSAMLAQQGSDFTKDDGSPNVNTPEMKLALTTLQSMQKKKIIATIPGGQPDTEEGYGYINEQNVASFAMPLWFMSRFVDYMPDLKGKFAIAPVPTFQAGQPRSVGLGGTGTAVIKTGKNVALAKEWLAYAKLSEDGERNIWNVLGFDPINTKLWTDPALTQDKNNKFIQYFQTNPFDTLNEIKDEIKAIKSVSASPTIYNALDTQALNSIFENGADVDSTLSDLQSQLENSVS
jgi:ABC-type sugar transport system, periplasmic component